MLVRIAALAVLCLPALPGAVSPARAMTQDEIVAKLQSAGYSQIQRIRSGKIASFKAVRDGKEVSIIVDSTGHVKELQ
jgi:Peptidase propeptide and YPEB domain